MPICFLKKSSGKKQVAAAPPPPAAEPSKPKPSPTEEAAGTMEHIMTGAEYPPPPRRLKNIQMIRYNFDDGLDDENYYGAQNMYYPNHGGYHPHAIAAPPYHPGMRHMSARSLPPPQGHYDYHAPPQYSNHLPTPTPYGHYPPAMPQRHYSPAPPPWQQFSPAPAPWGHFGPPRPHFGLPRPPFAPSMGHHCYGDY